MSTLLFPYELPEERIAQRPALPGASRLLHAQLLPDADLRISDRRFRELPELLRSGDLLVVNNSRVIPARFFPEYPASEVLLLRAESATVWQALARPMRKVERAQRFSLSPSLDAEVLGRTEDGERLRLRLISNSATALFEVLEAEGSMPIPPYIRSGRADGEDAERYQTIYAEIPGSVAAPTAGLHFTDEILAGCRLRGVQSCGITHHVGPASFLPVRDGDWQQHRMARESFIIPRASYESMLQTKERGGRVIAVGTTSVRALESFFAMDQRETLIDRECETELFITPGYEFKIVDVLITNFHQPLSTHLLLVAAFSGTDACRRIYEHALRGSYRFLSYGDSMLLEPQ